MEKCTVAHSVSTFLFRHGSWIYNQIAFLSRWQPIVMCRNTDNLDIYCVDRLFALDQLPVILRIYNRLAKQINGYFPLFSAALKEDKVALIHAHFGPEGYSSLALAHTQGVPLVTTFYGYDLSRLPHQHESWQRNYHALFQRGNAFLVEGSSMRQQLIELGCPGEKVFVQHLGVNLSQLPFFPRQVRNNGSIRVLVAGTFTEKKGLPYAVEAFARVCATHCNLHLTVVGDARNKPQEQHIKESLHEIVARNRISDKVTFLGSLTHAQLIEQYYLHDLFLSPSVQSADGDNEGGVPVTILEASATGMPILSTRHCDIPEAVIDGESGYLVEERNIDALVERLTELVEHPNKWVTIGFAGRRHIEDSYNAVIQSRLLEDYYDQFVSNAFR